MYDATDAGETVTLLPLPPENRTRKTGQLVPATVHAIAMVIIESRAYQYLVVTCCSCATFSHKDPLQLVFQVLKFENR